jgi:glycosyltransferase involved in cell wall biosynthesis
VRELGLEDYVWFTGIVSDDDLMRYLSTSDICLDPNPSNPLNDVSTWIKVMEYMALGKPIVAFDLKETRFSASKAALYVEPNNEEAFARAIVELMDDPARRREMGEFGIRRVNTDLKWDVVSTELLRAYETLHALKSRALQKA